MKKTLLISFLFLSACTHLSGIEEDRIRQLEAQGITIDHPTGHYSKPASVGGAAALNLLPGIGNFYLGTGNGGQSVHWLYGFVNLLLWPISILWSVPEAAIDANTINKKEMIYYYIYDKQGQKDLKTAHVVLD
ncbi:MAG: hypothetical protein J6Y85_01120 [Alphaproteobacteria bacterium]|nr:hypothetical protein [Alphaproteobacteria bacterium]